jgi:hypothetical protein
MKLTLLEDKTNICNGGWRKAIGLENNSQLSSVSAASMASILDLNDDDDDD